MWSSFRSNGNNQISYIIWLLMHTFYSIYLQCVKPQNCAITWNCYIVSKCQCIKIQEKKMKRINSWTQHQYGCIQFTYMYYYIKRESNKIIIYRKLNSRKCNEFYSIYAKIDDIDFCEQLNMVVYCCIVCIMMVISSKAFLSSSIFFFSNTSIHPSIHTQTIALCFHHEWHVKY